MYMMLAGSWSGWLHVAYFCYMYMSYIHCTVAG